MTTFDLAPKTWYLDLHYLGAPQLIACAVLETDAGLVLIDPGPETTLAHLSESLAERGYTLADVHAVLLTHIHLDHAGATGGLVEEQPEVQVYVHRVGRRHVVDPERLLRSARRLYGDDMDRLWGDVRPVPEEQVHTLYGDETITVGGRTLDVAHTPGHASHHVSYLDRATGTAFVGDTAGMAVTGADYVIPVAPPPDIDIERWSESLDQLEAWTPNGLFVTHFGPSEDVAGHLHTMRAKLAAWAEQVRTDLSDADDAARARAFHAACLARWREAIEPSYYPAYERFGLPESSWYGLARYWRKKAEREADGAEA